MLEKIKTIDRIEIINDVIQVRESTQVVEDGVTIGEPSFSRWCLCYGDDISDQDHKVQAIAKVIWEDVELEQCAIFPEHTQDYSSLLNI